MTIEEANYVSILAQATGPNFNDVLNKISHWLQRLYPTRNKIEWWRVFQCLVQNYRKSQMERLGALINDPSTEWAKHPVAINTSNRVNKLHVDDLPFWHIAKPSSMDLTPRREGVSRYRHEQETEKA